MNRKKQLAVAVDCAAAGQAEPECARLSAQQQAGAGTPNFAENLPRNSGPTVRKTAGDGDTVINNTIHRALFSLPPIQLSEQRDVAVPELPPQVTVTGDKEIDAVMWLHSVIETGQAPLIEKAMEAAKRIKTPLKKLEKRYRDYLARTRPGDFVAVISSIGFSDLDEMARRSVKRNTRQQEARARFGDRIWDDTPAELFCIEALAGVDDDPKCPLGRLDSLQVDARFDARSDQRPHTLDDCLHELTYWSELYWLRNACGECGDGGPEADARDDYAFRQLALIRPRTTAEAVLVFQFLVDNKRMQWTETNDILLNLIGGDPLGAFDMEGT